MTGPDRECMHCGKVGDHHCSFHELDVYDIIGQLEDWEAAAEVSARAFAKAGEYTMETFATHRRHTIRDIRTWIEENR